MSSTKTVRDHLVARIPLPSGDSQLRKRACLNRIRLPPTFPPESPQVTSDDIKNSAVQPGPIYKELHLGMFEIGKPLGKGKFGRVYLARHRESGYICALKMLKKEEITREKAEMHVRREIEVHSNLRHPGILGFYGWFYDSRRIFIILEYAAGGELYKVLQREGTFPEQRAAQYIAQVTSSIIYLHGKNVMHRDMKPENILIGLYGELKLADFGYSVHAPSNRRNTLCGTLDYLPPEMIRSSQLLVSYTKAVDLWTLGVLTYEFLTGEAPFEDGIAMTQRRIVKGAMKPLPSRLSPEAKDFVHSLLVLDPSKRLPLQDVLNHPWIAKNCNMPRVTSGSK
ncbi:serine/threonine-protein kinase [Nemania serpens]|nr:serine/threonine-protein kinase [Nemania serpens]